MHEPNDRLDRFPRVWQHENGTFPLQRGLHHRTACREKHQPLVESPSDPAAGVPAVITRCVLMIDLHPVLISLHTLCPMRVCFPADHWNQGPDKSRKLGT